MTNAFYVALTFKLRTMGSAERALAEKSAHDSPWDHLGVNNGDIEKAVTTVVGDAGVDMVLPFAERLWNEPIWEFKISALCALALKQIEATDELWSFVGNCLSQIEEKALSDRLSPIAEKCLIADLDRIDDLAAWAGSPHKWTRRAVAAFTMNEDIGNTAQIRVWVDNLSDDRDPRVRTAAADWLAARG